MPELSMTTLIDIVSRAGTPKATSISRAKSQDAAEYDPAADFYKGVRESIIAAHSNGAAARSHLTAFLKSGITDGKKVASYTAIVKGYLQWLGRKNVVWFTPPRNSWSGGHGFDIRVNPELGLTIDSRDYIVKLHFKADDNNTNKMSKDKAKIILFLMNETLVPQRLGAVVSLLDVRKGKLHYSEASPENLGHQLRAEIAYIAEYWPNA